MNLDNITFSPFISLDVLTSLIAGTLTLTLEPWYYAMHNPLNSVWLNYIPQIKVISSKFILCIGNLLFSGLFIKSIYMQLICI